MGLQSSTTSWLYSITHTKILQERPNLQVLYQWPLRSKRLTQELCAYGSLLTASVQGRVPCLPRRKLQHTSRAILKNARTRTVAFHCMLTGSWQVMVGILPPLAPSAISQRNCNISDSARVKWRHVPWGEPPVTHPTRFRF